jgi:hypothetical protein
MLRRLAFCAAVIGTIFCASPTQCRRVHAEPPPSAPDRRGAEPTSSRDVWSPLHAFLGIDPITGQFKPAGGSRQSPVPANSAGPAFSTDSSESAVGDPTGGPPDTQVGDMTLEELRTALTNAIDQNDDGAAAATLTRLTRGIGYEPFSLFDPRIERACYAVLFLYPLGIVLSELYGAWSRRHSLSRAEFERRFYARQRRRRFMLAACSTASIALFWWASENSFWWNDSQRLAGFVAGLTFLMGAAAILRLLIATAAKDYPRRVIQELRIQQLALEKEIQELRRRLQDSAFTESVQGSPVSGAGSGVSDFGGIKV